MSFAIPSRPDEVGPAAFCPVVIVVSFLLVGHSLIDCVPFRVKHLGHFMEHRQIFSRGDDKNPAARAASGHVRIRPTGRIGRDIQLQSQALQAGANCFPDLVGMLANAGREHRGIHATHRHRQGPNRLSNPVRVDRQGQLGLFVTGTGGVQNLPHVARDARNSQQSDS